MYGIVTTIVVIGILVSFVGVFFQLGIFGHRRIIALGVLILLGTGGIALSDALRSPEQIAKDEAIAARGSDNDAAGYNKVEADPEDFIGVETTYDAFGDLQISGTLTNSSNFTIMNVKLRCDQYGQTTKRLARSSITIAQHVPANGKAQFGPLSIGLPDQQLQGVRCVATDGDIVPGTARSADIAN